MGHLDMKTSIAHVLDPPQQSPSPCQKYLQTLIGDQIRDEMEGVEF